MNKESGYWKNIYFQFSGNLFSQIIGVISLPLLTRIYTPEAFSIQALFLQITSFLTIYIAFRYEYFIPILKTKKESILISSFVIKVGAFMTILMTLLFWGIDILIRSYSEIASFNNIFYLAPLTAFLISISLMAQHECQRRSEFKVSGLAEIYAKFSYVLSGVICGGFSTTVGLVLTTGFAAIGKLVYLSSYLFGLLKIKKIQETTSLSVVKEYKNRSVSLVIANSIGTISGLMPLIYLENRYGPNILGQFALAFGTIFFPASIIGAAVGNVFYLRSSNLLAKKEYINLVSVWNETLKKLVLFSAPIYIGIYFLGPTLYPIIFGDGWELSGKFAKIMCLAAFFSFVAGPLDRLSIVLGLSMYLPFLHSFRIITIGFSIFIADFYSSDASAFVLYLSCSLAITYGVDIFFMRLKLQALKLKSYV